MIATCEVERSPSTARSELPEQKDTMRLLTAKLDEIYQTTDKQMSDRTLRVVCRLEVLFNFCSVLKAKPACRWFGRKHNTTSCDALPEKSIIPPVLWWTP